MQTRCKSSAGGHRGKERRKRTGETSMGAGEAAPVPVPLSHYLGLLLDTTGVGWWDERENCGMAGMRKTQEHLSPCVRSALYTSSLNL